MQEYISKLATGIVSLFTKNKWKSVTFIVSIPLFTLLNFPYDDLGDFFTSTVSEQTRNQVYMQFDQMGLEVFPTPALALNNVEVDTPTLPTIKAGQIRVAPSIAGLLSSPSNPGFRANAEDIFKGEVDLALMPGRTEEKVQFQKVDLELDGVDIKSLATIAPLPIQLTGKANGTVDGEFDPSFSLQPEGTLKLALEKLKINRTMVMGIGIPQIDLKLVNLDGELVNEELRINEAILGSKGDKLTGKIKGFVKLTLKKDLRTKSVAPQWGQYELSIMLDVTKELEQDDTFKLVQFYIDNQAKGARKPGKNGSQYAFRLKGNNFFAPPRIQPISRF